MKVQLILVSFKRESKELEKILLLYAFISYPVKISVCECSCCIKEWKRKEWNHMCWTVIINHVWKNIDKKRWKKTALFWKKFWTFEMKNILHPRKISVKCYIFFYLFITSNSPMAKMKYISIFLWNIFKRCRGMPLQGHLPAARNRIMEVRRNI